MSNKSVRQYAQREAIDLCRRNIEAAEIRLAREDNGLEPCERGLINLLLANASRDIKLITRTEDTDALELRIAQAHRLRAALDCRLRRDSFRVVDGGQA